MKLSEADITKQIRDVLNICHIFHWKQWQGPLSQPKGVSDILGIYKGRMLAIEVKKEGWEPPNPGTKVYDHFVRQRDFLKDVRDEGGIGFFANCVEDVIERLGLQNRLTPLFKGR